MLKVNKLVRQKVRFVIFLMVYKNQGLDKGKY